MPVKNNLPENEFANALANKMFSSNPEGFTGVSRPYIANESDLAYGLPTHNAAPDPQIAQLTQKVEGLQDKLNGVMQKIDNIFGNHILINGTWILL